MQVNGRVRTPPLSHFTHTDRLHHSYTSSSADSYDGLHSHSRSASGTSQTNYDDPMATPPPPQVLMQEYTQPSSPNDTPQRRSGDFQKSQKLPIPDQMTMHLLLETALDDCRSFEILTPEELYEIKKEQRQLSRRIESAKRRLFIESRVNSTTHSLQRLDSKVHKRQSPEFKLNGISTANGHDNTVPLQPPTSKKCEELANNVWRLERRHAELQERCVKHTAAVLQLQYQTQIQNKPSQSAHEDANAFDSDDDDEGGARQLDFNEGLMDFSDTPRNLQARLQALSGELYSLISSSGPYSKAGYTKPPDDGAGSDDDLTYIEMGLSIVKGLHQELVRYANDSVEKVRRHEQTNGVLTNLWDVVSSSERDLERSKQAMRMVDGTFQGLEDDSSDEEDAFDYRNQPYSLPAFSERVERICSKAASLSQRHVAVQQQLSHEREMNGAANANITAQIETKLAEIEEINDQLKDSQATIAEKEDLIHQLEDEREDMESEIARLQTDLTVARAELEESSGTRGRGVGPDTQREMDELIRRNTDLMSSKDEVEERADMLQRELSELVTEYESMVRQNVEAEKAREALEGVVDNLKERKEEAEAKLKDEKIRNIGKNNGKGVNGETTLSIDSTSMGIMRNEFKKLMRDSRAEHFKTLKAEQEERRRLEAIIRNMRKEQNSTAAASKSTLSKPVAAA